MKKIDNINNYVWKILDTDLSIKKDLARGIINTRALANYILSTQKIDASLDSIISAIRRYEAAPEKKEETKSVHAVLQQARITTRSKMASLLLKRTDIVKTKLGRPDRIMDFQGHETIRVFEGSQALTLVFDRHNFDKIRNFFPKQVILEESKKVGIIEINYPRILKKTPGVFAIIYNELAENGISVTDALISPNEHILVVEEAKFMQAFEKIHALCNIQ